MHGFVAAATKELMWLSEKEEEEVGFDWSERNSNMAAKKEAYSVRRGPSVGGRAPRWGGAPRWVVGVLGEAGPLSGWWVAGPLSEAEPLGGWWGSSVGGRAPRWVAGPAQAQGHLVGAGVPSAALALPLRPLPLSGPDA